MAETSKLCVLKKTITEYLLLWWLMCSYTSDTGKNYDFNTDDTLNTLLLNCMLVSGQLKEGEMYDVDFNLYG